MAGYCVPPGRLALRPILQDFVGRGRGWFGFNMKTALLTTQGGVPSSSSAAVSELGSIDVLPCWGTAGWYLGISGIPAHLVLPLVHPFLPGWLGIEPVY